MSAFTFTRVTQTHDRLTGRVTPQRLTFTFAAIGLDGNDAYRLFGLVTQRQVALGGCTEPGVYPPRVGDTFPFGGETYTVKDTKPFSPNGIDTPYIAVLGEK